jgi:hypothetical protein
MVNFTIWGNMKEKVRHAFKFLSGSSFRLRHHQSSSLGVNCTYCYQDHRCGMEDTHSLLRFRSGGR